VADDAAAEHSNPLTSDGPSSCPAAYLDAVSYLPFGAGSRQCVGMRFGRLEVEAIAACVVREHRLELPPGHRLEVRQTPTLGPKQGLRVTLRAA
jgi:cytochrome P450